VVSKRTGGKGTRRMGGDRSRSAAARKADEQRIRAAREKAAERAAEDERRNGRR
jgi:hypothetical protein